MKQYWLMKSEPEAFSIDDLKRRAPKAEGWDGVRNYQARNMMRDQMQVGDLAFFYHSNAKPSGIAGIMQISKQAYPDPTQFDPNSKYYDPTATPDNPRWFMVGVTFKQKFGQLISLEELKQHPGLANMPLMRRGNRLSIMPVTEAEWGVILGMVGK